MSRSMPRGPKTAMQRGGRELSYFAYGNGRLEVSYSRMRGKEGKEKDKKGGES